MTRALLIVLAVLLTLTLSAVKPPPAHADCRAEPFAGDVNHDSSSQASGIYISTGTVYALPRGRTSDSFIPAGNCRDVDYVKITSGWKLEYYTPGFGWAYWRSSVGWHKISPVGGNMTLRAIHL